jgi:hypothetical protein
MAWLPLILAFGAVARLTRLLTVDTFPPIVWGRAHLRAWLIRSGRDDENHWSVRLLGCAWCISFWIAAPVMALAYWFGPTAAFLIPAGTLTASHAAGMLAGDR